MKFRKTELKECVYPENSKYKEGDVVEFLKNNVWSLGEVQLDYEDKELLVWPLKGNDYGRLHEVPIRRTPTTIKKARAYFEEMIGYYQDIIDHRGDRERIAEYRAKIKKLRGDKNNG